MNTWIGDWLNDYSKMENLTEERAIQDIWAMSESPDYTDDDVSRAMNLSRKQFGYLRDEWLAIVMMKKEDAHQMP